MKADLNSENFEKGLLLNLYYDNNLISKVIEVITSLDFSNKDYSKIYNLFIANYQNGKKTNHNEIIINLPELVKTSMNLEVEKWDAPDFNLCLLKLKDYSIKRDIVKTLKQVSNEFNNIDSLEIIGRLSELNKLTISNNSQILNIKEIQTEHSKYLKDIKDGTNLIYTGYDTYDKYYGAFKVGDLIIVAARTGVGKTAFVTNLISNLMKQDKSIGMVSLEMSSSEIYQRILQSDLQLTKFEIESGNYDNFINEYNEKNKDKKLFIDITSWHNELTLFNNINTFRLKHKIDILFVDYLQLVKSSVNKKSYTYEIKEVTRMLKMAARQFNIPIVALSQVNREAKNKKEPDLENLSDSDAIGQDANTVLILNEVDNAEDVQRIDLLIKKQRNGKKGKIEFNYLKNFTKFVEVGTTLKSDNELNNEFIEEVPF